MLDKLAKALVKSMLSSAAPIVGKLVVDVGSEMAAGLIDAGTKRLASDLEGRLVGSLTRDLEAIGRAEKIVDADIERVAGVTQELVRGPLLAVWIDTGFDAGRAAAALLAAQPEVVSRLGSHEKTLVERLLVAGFAALDRERAALDDTEAAFRRAVLRRLDELLARDATDRGGVVDAALLSLPLRVFRPDLSPPGALLRADIDRPVPFHGRESELDDFERWATDGGAMAVRLVTGRGGMGKTRLLLEACRQLRLRGWAAGFLDRAASQSPDGTWPAIVQGGDPLFLVIDYAEHQRPLIAAIVSASLRHYGARRMRLVLLARSGDEWWSALQREGDGVGELLAGPATSRVELRPVATDPEGRHRSYKLARDHFAAVLARTATGPEPTYGDPDFVRILLLHMHALAAIEGVATTGDQGILNEMLARERRYWERRLDEIGLGRQYERAVMQSMAAVTLAGGAANRGEATGLIRRLPLLSGQTAVVIDTIAGLLHEVYQGERWIDPVLPDLLGEHLAQIALDDDADVLLDLVLGERVS